MGKSIHSFVGGELSFLKLGSVLVGFSQPGDVKNFSWRCENFFFLKASTAKVTVFEVKCVFWLNEVVPGQIHT